MQLDHLSDPKLPHLPNLIQLSRYWKQLDHQIKQLLPTQLHPHMRVVCIENGELIIHSTSSMAGLRIKMLLPTLLPEIQNINTQIQSIKIKVKPQEPKKTKQKNFQISTHALTTFEQTAQRLEKQHPELANTIQRLVKNHKKPAQN